MKIFSFLSLLVLPFITFGQITNTMNLDFNNVHTILSDGGLFFNNYGASIAQYEVPAGNGASAIYAMSNWFGGTDVNGQLYLAAQTYGVHEDFQPGPLTTDGSATAVLPSQWPQTLFAVSKSEIDNHIQNYTNPGYVVPQSLLDWPAHGDVSLGFDYYLAPFVDMNNDGNYNPIDGDYPCIKGNFAVYIIMNDKKIHTASGGDPIGIELHYMFYQYGTSQNLINTTFMDLKMINRSTRTLYDFKFSTFMDGDLGYYGDDYIGSDSTRNLGYVYNGDNFDELSGGSTGYGQNPPAIGLISLSHDLASNMYVTSTALSTTAHFWNMMNALDQFGQPFVEPGSNNIVDFIYNGDPESSSGSTELQYNNAPGDRRLLSTVDVGTLLPYQEEDFTVAFIYHRGTSNLNSVTGLLPVADEVQQFFDGVTTNCFDEATASINEVNNETLFSVSPNPSNGSFTVHFTSNATGNVNVLDMTGREVYSTQTLNEQAVEIDTRQPAGVYLLVVETTDGAQTERIFIK